MNARQRLTAALLLALAIAMFAPHTPALAQSVPSTCQYETGPCPSSAEVQDLGDGADAFSENAGQGTDAVNEALDGPEASASAAGVSPNSVESVASAESSSPEGEAASEDGEAPASITRLPETGGASLAALGSGMLLVAFGLAARRLARR